MAERSKLQVLSVVADAEGSLERHPDRRFDIPSIVLRPLVTLAREADRERAQRLIEKAEDAGLIRRSMLTEISLEPVIVVADGAQAQPIAGHAADASDSDARHGW